MMHCIEDYPPAGRGPPEPQNGLGRPGSPCHQEAAQHSVTSAQVKLQYAPPNASNIPATKRQWVAVSSAQHEPVCMPDVL